MYIVAIDYGGGALFGGRTATAATRGKMQQAAQGQTCQNVL